MLGTKNKYALLYVFFMQLGCSSSYRYQMENPEGSKSGPSSGISGGKVMTRSEHEDVKKKVCNVVNNFLERQQEKVKKGFCISNDTIQLAISLLPTDINNIDINSLPIDYKVFLNTYGSIYGQGYHIFGPVDQATGNQQEAEHIASIQRGFKEHCKANKKLKKIKSYWLIAEIDESDQYYIDLSDKGKGRIYSIDRDGKSRIFSENFVEFLVKFFESFDESQNNSTSSDSN